MYYTVYGAGAVLTIREVAHPKVRSNEKIKI